MMGVIERIGKDRSVYDIGDDGPRLGREIARRVVVVAISEGVSGEGAWSGVGSVMLLGDGGAALGVMIARMRYGGEGEGGCSYKEEQEQEEQDWAIAHPRAGRGCG